MQTQTGMEATELDKVENYLSSGEKYRYEWSCLIASLDPHLSQLRHLAYNGDLKVSKFRSICWSVLLRVLTSNPGDWREQREQQRKRYQRLKLEFVKNPHTLNSTNDNPLSQSKQSVWNQYFGDQELFSVIKQDVVRTFPGVDFFRKQFVQEAMTNILFYYAREHPYMSYRQGMHEILAPILFVIFYDHQSLLHFKEISENIDELLADVLDPNYLEEDCYSLFSRLMSSIESYYRIANMVPSSDGYFPPESSSPTDDKHQNSETEVIGQLNLIRDKILAKEDQHLHNHLQKLEIPLQIFGIRWLRLLFGREFPLLDLLMLWDAIFAESDNFQLPNYILVAMLVRIRDKLILSDYTSCLTYLMRYPNNIDIGLILRHALHMHSPTKFERPANALIPLKPLNVTIENENTKTSTKSNFYRQLQTHTLPKKLNKPLKPTLSEEAIGQTSDALERTRSSSMSNRENKGREKNKNNGSEIPSPKILDRSFQATIEELQYANALNLVRIEKLKASQHSDENVILDGFSAESPEYLRLKLQNAETVIAVSRIKLGKYLETLRKYSNNGPDDLCQAVDGIGELCAFLNITFTRPSNEPVRVDAAFEANENQLKQDKTAAVGTIKPNTTRSPTKSNSSSFVYIDLKNCVKESQDKPAPANSNRKSNNNISEADVKKEFVKILEANNKHPYEVQVGEDNNAVDFRPPQSISNDTSEQNACTADNSTAKGSTRYEIPDTGFMKNSHKILGTRKDVELTIFKEGNASVKEEKLPIIDPLNLKSN